MKGLDVFLAVAMSKTLHDASDMLGLSPSSVSYNLKCLEQVLGVELIERKKGFKSIKLTSYGAKLLPLAIQYEKINREILDISKNLRSQLHIGSVESINHCLLPQFLQSFGKHNIDIVVETNSSMDLQYLVENKKMDIAFVVSQMPSTKLIISPILKENFKLICACNITGQTNAIHINQLDPNFEIFVNWSLSFQIWHDRIWKDNQRAKFQLASIVHIEPLLCGDKRYWIIAPVSVAKYYANKGLNIYDITPPPPPRICYKITHQTISQEIIQILKLFDIEWNRWLEINDMNKGQVD